VTSRQRTMEAKLDPAQGPYLLIVSCWHAGLEGEFHLAVCSPGSVTLQQTLIEKPTPAESVLMAPLKLQSTCGTCNTTIKEYDRKIVRGLCFHFSCVACSQCGAVSKHPFFILFFSPFFFFFFFLFGTQHCPPNHREQSTK